jgi:ABC-type transport system substrate-binding protein
MEPGMPPKGCIAARSSAPSIATVGPHNQSCDRRALQSFVRSRSDYWRPGRPYLDGIDWRIIPNRATRVLAFVAGEFDLTFVGDVTVPISRQLAAQAPQAQCRLVPTNVTTNSSIAI